MEEYKIVMSCENDAIEKELRRIVESKEGVRIVTGNTKNLDGAILMELLGDWEHLLMLLSAMATMISFMETRIQLYGPNKKMLRQNIKVKDIVSYLKNLKK